MSTPTPHPAVIQERKRIASLGGKASAEVLTPEQRAERARRAALSGTPEERTKRARKASMAAKEKRDKNKKA